MIISDFYQTKIEASSYNVNIDSNNTVITVSLIDFNGAPVTGKSVTLTVDRGYFNKNGSTAISGTTTKSITATTNSNGKITATYTASEWGLATFSTNTTNIQVNVTGWRIARNDSNYLIKYTDKLVFARVSVNNSANWTTTIAHLGAEWVKDPYHPEIDLRPPMPVSVSPSANKTIMLSDADYRVGFFTHTGTGTGGLYASFTYARK